MRDVSPKLAAEGISRQVEDRKLTLEMKNVTVHIEDLIKNEENALTRFLQDFKSLSNWIMSQQGFIELNVRNSIVAECLRLKDNADASIHMLDQITRWTEGEKIADERKIVMKVQLEEDFQQQEKLVKVLEYPEDMVALVKDIGKVVKEAKAEVAKDEEIEERTESSITAFRDSIVEISHKLSKMTVQLVAAQSSQEWRTGLDEITKDVEKLLLEFTKLDKLERVHLQMLLKLYEFEGQSLMKQAQLKDVREPQDLDYIQEDF